MTEQQEAARFWNARARGYAASPIKDLAGYERTLARTQALLRASDVVFEIGCGTGTTALAIAPHVARLTASDVSSEMIAIAREKAAARGIENVAFEVAAADVPIVPDGSCDAVLAFNVLHLMRARGCVLAEARRALKPGGLLVTKTPCVGEMNVMIRLAIPLMRAVRVAPPVAVFGAGALEADIAGAGFDVVERARHGSDRRDPRLFLVARKPLEPAAA